MTEPSESRYLIHGTGAIGSVFGGLLQESGSSVSFLGRGSHFKRIMSDGLKITGIWGDHLIPASRINGFTDPSDINYRFQVIFLSVKSNDTVQAAREVTQLLESDGIVVSLQNGLNNWETIAQHAGGRRTVGARVIFGSEILEPGTAKVSVYADPVLLGAPFDEVNQALLQACERDLNRAGIPTSIVSRDEIWAAIWGKVLYNSALNPLSAILEVPYGALAKSIETRAVMYQVITEIFLVMERKGMKVPFKTAEDYYRFFMEKQLPATVDHRSSMLQDIMIGRRTEIDALNGAISGYAKEMGLATPYNDFLLHLIKFKESYNR